MKITDEIGTSHYEALEKILKFILKFDVYKLLYAIQERKPNEEFITNLTCAVRDQHTKLQRQKSFLFRYTEAYNEEYALADNKFVDNSQRMLRKMRSGVKGIKMTTRKFCKTSRMRWPEDKPAPQAIDRSALSAEAYMKDLFGLESYPDYVKELFAEMAAFYQTMNECIQEAFRSLKLERNIKGDKRRCMELLTKACEESRAQQTLIIEIINSDPRTKDALLRNSALQPNANPMLNAWENVQSDEGRKTFAATWFHNCTSEDIQRITIRKMVKEADGDPDLVECMSLFSCDREKALCINQAIDQFDDLLPEKCKGGYIPSCHLYVFMRWGSTTISYDKFLQYFNKRYKSAGGKWSTIKKSALSRAARENARSTATFEKTQWKMETKLDDFFSQKQAEMEE